MMEITEGGRQDVNICLAPLHEKCWQEPGDHMCLAKCVYMLLVNTVGQDRADWKRVVSVLNQEGYGGRVKDVQKALCDKNKKYEIIIDTFSPPDLSEEMLFRKIEHSLCNRLPVITITSSCHLGYLVHRVLPNVPGSSRPKVPDYHAVIVCGLKHDKSSLDRSRIYYFDPGLDLNANHAESQHPGFDIEAVRRDFSAEIPELDGCLRDEWQRFFHGSFGNSGVCSEDYMYSKTKYPTLCIVKSITKL